MADVNHVITLGIGTPGDVEHFTLFGLTANPAPAAVVADLVALARGFAATARARLFSTEATARGFSAVAEEQ